MPVVTKYGKIINVNSVSEIPSNTNGVHCHGNGSTGEHFFEFLEDARIHDCNKGIVEIKEIWRNQYPDFHGKVWVLPRTDPISDTVRQ